MTIKKALQTIIEKHGRDTYGEIQFPDGYTRRLDIEYQLRAHDEYLHDCVYESKVPMDRTFRISLGHLSDDEFIEYTIYRTDKHGALKFFSTVYIFPLEEYPDRDWEATFAETKYPRNGIPWWKK